jgi:hypothetical protein
MARCTRYDIKVCQRLTEGRRLSPGTPVSSTNKTDHHDIAEILLKVVLNTITLVFLMLKTGIVINQAYAVLKVLINPKDTMQLNIFHVLL